MLIDPKADFHGFPMLLARNALRCFPTPGAGRSWERVLGVIEDERDARRLVKALICEGYLAEFHPEKRRKGEPAYYHRTVTGQRFAMASARPLKRARAERMLRDLVERARSINRNDDFVYRVGALVVFGSYVDSTREVLGDLDVAFVREDRYVQGTDDDYMGGQSPKAVAERRSRERGANRFSTMVDTLFWPDKEFRLALKGRTAGLSLHDFGDEREVIVGGPHKVVFGMLPLREPRPDMSSWDDDQIERFLDERDRKRFRAKFGREPGPDEPLCFDPDEDSPMPKPPPGRAAIENRIYNLTRALDVESDWAYAMVKTGFSPKVGFRPGDLRMDPRYTLEEMDEFIAKMAEYVVWRAAGEPPPGRKKR